MITVRNPNRCKIAVVKGLIVMLPTNTPMTSMPERERTPAEAVLEHQRQKEGRGADRHPEQGAAQVDDPERRDAKDAAGPAEGVRSSAGGRPPTRAAPAPTPDAHFDGSPRDAAIGDELEPVDEGAQPGASQDESPPVEARHRSGRRSGTMRTATKRAMRPSGRLRTKIHRHDA